MKVAVVLPVYKNDNLELLKEAVESIFLQNLENFSIVIPIDGKIPDATSEYLNSLSSEKVTLLSFEDNRGLPSVLNDAINYCKNTGVSFVARMDADDISEFSRLTKQLRYLEKNPGVDMVGTSAIIIDEKGGIIGKKKLSESVSFDSLMKGCSIIHPSVMFRINFFEKFGYYDPHFRKSQDYELWLRASKKGAVLRNLSEPLLYLRYENQIIQRRKNEQPYNLEIKRKYAPNIFTFYKSIIPHLLILCLPVWSIRLILNLRSRN